MVAEPYQVLLIEDTADDEHLALRALRRCGLPLLARIARDGEQAMHMLGLAGGPAKGTDVVPQLVISDLKLPKVSGDDLLRMARADARFAQVPWVIFSSSDEEAGIARCRKFGASDYVVKPLEFDRYLDVLSRIAYDWLAVGRPNAPTPSFWGKGAS